MKGYDYDSQEAVDRSISEWKSAARAADYLREFTGEGYGNGETHLYRKGNVLIAEIYGINLPLQTKQGTSK